MEVFYILQSEVATPHKKKMSYVLNISLCWSVMFDEMHMSVLVERQEAEKSFWSIQ